jgi:beta-glucanase (GH16 family)
MYKLLVVFAFAVCGCACNSKETVATNNSVPTNLNLSAVVSTDNSGNVTFTATATNATNYDFNFGNGAFQLVPSGTITYKYAASGTYNVIVIAKNAAGASASKTIDVVVTVGTTAGLIWSDEFNTPGSPDPSKWGYDIGTGSGGWGNNELQYYTNRPENVVVANGVLKINAIRENFSGSSFTSARLLTKDKFSFKYGRIEVRAKLPAGVGTWPAIWMLGSNFSTAGWPNCGEIDIMEHRGMELNKIFSTMHYPGNSGANGVGGTTVISNATTEFHLYSAVWDTTQIKFYVDNQLFFTFSNNNSIPFNQNFFFILNVAMGGNFAGPVASSFNSATMEVDYIRVYQ